MDAELVVRAQHGEQQAFASLAMELGPRLHAVAYRVLRDPSLAEDAVQQALLDIWQDLPTLRDPQRCEAWSYRVLVRVSYALARRRRRLLDIDDLPAPIGMSERGYAAVVQRDELERGFERLSIEQRTAVVLHHYLGLPVRDVAEAVGAPEETVRTRLRRALASLRVALGAEVPAGAEREMAEGLTR